MSKNNNEKWWKKAVVYQIYPKSFQDSNGDGFGDLQGIIKRLDYLETLGINAIWLSPVFKSPQADNGYDISDYRDIDPTFGSLDDMEELINEAKKHNIRIMMDLVLNHSSNEHRWFKEAKKSKDNPYHDYYIWRDGDEGVPPSDMKACFGGSAWEYVPEIGQYYFHQFLPEQPDLNWENPKVRRAIYDMILWWMDKGVGGFRLDVIDQIAKEPDKRITINGPRLQEYFKELSRETFQQGDLITVGEAWGADTERAKLYSNPDGSEFSMVFQFEHIGLDQKEGGEKWDLAPLPFKKLKKIMAHWQNELYNCGWNSLFWDNHDLPRIVSRWGNDREYRVESAKMLAILLHGMQGTPYIYQGEELGYWGSKQNGDEYVRTPILWDKAAKELASGALSGKIDKSMLTAAISVEAQDEDEGSLLNLYRTFARLRNTYPALAEGEMTRHPVYNDGNAAQEAVAVWYREKDGQRMLVAHNFSNKAQTLTLTDALGKAVGVSGTVTLKKNDGEALLTLGGYSSVVFTL